MPLIFVALAVGVPVGLLWWWAHDRGDGSELEDVEGEAVNGSTLIESSIRAKLSDAIGWPYFFGKGSPSTPWEDGPEGVDCSGFVQMALVRLGKLASTASDRGAATLADDSDPIAVGSQRAGDLAYYPGHVVLVVGSPGADGHSPVMSASGGTSTTFGDDPNARVKVFSTAEYRSDFVTYMRLRA